MAIRVRVLTDPVTQEWTEITVGEGAVETFEVPFALDQVDLARLAGRVHEERQRRTR